MGIRPGMTRRRGAAGGLGEDGPNRWALSINDGGTLTGGRPAHARRWAKALQRGEKTAQEDFPIFKFVFLFDIPNRWNNNFKNYLVISEKCETLHGDRFDYLPQVLYWAL
jgi:hypothetical protein